TQCRICDRCTRFFALFEARLCDSATTSRGSVSFFPFVFASTLPCPARDHLPCVCSPACCCHCERRSGQGFHWFASFESVFHWALWHTRALCKAVAHAGKCTALHCGKTNRNMLFA